MAQSSSPKVMASPLHTEGRWIVDRNDRRIKLAGVNWYGAEEKDHVAAGRLLFPAPEARLLLRPCRR